MSLADYVDTIEMSKTVLRDWNAQHENIERLPGLIARQKGTAQEAASIRKLEKAWEYFQDVIPVWEHLGEEERFCLAARFVERGKKGGIPEIMARFSIGRSEAYRRSDAALAHFAKLLFW